MKYRFKCVVCGGKVNEYFTGKACEDCGIQYRDRPKNKVYEAKINVKNKRKH